MASLQHPTTSLQSKHVPIPRNTLTQKPILNISLPSTTFTPLKLKFYSTTAAIRRSYNTSKARLSATATPNYATTLTDVANSNNTLDIQRLLELKPPMRLLRPAPKPHGSNGFLEDDDYYAEDKASKDDPFEGLL
ncbi:ATP synthase delta chain [Spatholobus suberectus]|nr:ATP synthase delta chain [Spatholobus suberectus]